MIGAGGIAAVGVSGLTARGIQVPDILDLVATRAQCYLQPSPWLEFYTITTVSNGVLRYVDFQDPDAGGSLPNLVPFNGNEFEARRISRSPIRSAADSITTFSITFDDVLSDLVPIVRAEGGLPRAPIQIDIIPYDLIDQPALAMTETYKVRQAAASFSPSKVSLELGLPSLVDIDIPNFTMSRYRCFNDYNRKSELDSLCRAPSDDFNVGTAQTLGSDEFDAAATTWPATNTKRGFGWRTLNADIADTWKTSDVPLPAVFASDLWTVCESAFPTSQIWLNGARSGMYMFKLMPDVADWAVETHLSFLDNVKLQRNSGFIIQDDADEDEWVFWGNAINAGTTEVLRRRVTTAGISTTTDDTDLSDGSKYFRIEYDVSTTTLTLYVKPDNSSPWVSKFTTVKDMGTTMRVGLVLASDVTGLVLLSTHFRFMRFTAGGPAKCNRSIEECREVGRDNEHQFNGFPGIPDRATNF